MTDLANRDQALKLEWEKLIGDAVVEAVEQVLIDHGANENADAAAGMASAVLEALRPTAIEYGRRVLALAERAEELVKRLGVE